MPTTRRQVPNVEDVLTPAAIQSILAKEALFKAGIAPSKGGLISASKPNAYVIHLYSWSHSATPHRPLMNEEDNARVTMLASESVLRREWNSREEDEAWADL